MEAVVLIGLQASGKSSFYLERYFATHVRISLDQLRTRHREQTFLAACLSTSQPFVIDNTNPTKTVRAPYLEAARKHKFTISGYYFRSNVVECLARNQKRAIAIPEVGIIATAKRLERPTLCEGFDSLHYVQLTTNDFCVQEWADEL